MTENKRFMIKKDGFDKYVVSDKINQFPMPITNKKSCEAIAFALNSLWEQTQRFEKHNQELIQRSIQYEDKIDELKNENEKLKQENKHYKYILQDLGLLMTDEEVRDIRIEIADKFINPLCKENGFDVDVDCTNGFTIIPKR